MSETKSSCSAHNINVNVSFQGSIRGEKLVDQCNCMKANMRVVSRLK